MLPNLGLLGGCSILHLALSRVLLQGDAGMPGVDGRPGLEGFPGPQVGASAPPFQKPPLAPGRVPLHTAGPLGAAPSPAAKIQPQQPKSAPSSQNPPPLCLQLFPCSGSVLTVCQGYPCCLGPHTHQLATLLAVTSTQKHPTLACCLDLAGGGGLA